LSRYEAAGFRQAELRSYWGWRAGRSGAGVKRFEDEGEAGLLDRRLGKASGQAVPWIEAMRWEAPVSHALRGFTAPSFSEHLVKEHNFSWAIRGRRLPLLEGFAGETERRGLSAQRERRPLPGMMLHQERLDACVAGGSRRRS